MSTTVKEILQRIDSLEEIERKELDEELARRLDRQLDKWEVEYFGTDQHVKLLSVVGY